MQKILIANWKMNGNLEQVHQFCIQIKNSQTPHRIVFCPPFPYLTEAKKKLGDFVGRVGAQNLSPHKEGPYTGEVSASMLKEVGCESVLIGHSERRTHFGETSNLLKEKITTAQENDLIAVLCVGENYDEYKKGISQEIILQQLAECLPTVWDPKKLWIAYEPVWSIGTGLIPTEEEIEGVLKCIKGFFKEKPIPVLYGGSVNAANAKEIMEKPYIDGVLVGGASLNWSSFEPIVMSYSE